MAGEAEIEHLNQRVAGFHLTLRNAEAALQAAQAQRRMAHREYYRALREWAAARFDWLLL